MDRTRTDQEFCTVAVDDVLGGRLAVEHLIDRGHRRVAFVGARPASGQALDRLEGARRAWANASLLQQATTTGAPVPGDLAIVGYDDIDFAAAAAVPLTSVRQPRHELGRTAAEIVIDEAGNGSHLHRQVVFTPDLVARSSTLG